MSLTPGELLRMSADGRYMSEGGSYPRPCSAFFSFLPSFLPVVGYFCDLFFLLPFTTLALLVSGQESGFLTTPTTRSIFTG